MVPCPPPPPKPFPWIYVWALLSFLTIVGAFYRSYLMYLARDIQKPPWKPRRRVKRPAYDEQLPPCVQYLIVGAGSAGWAAFESIMEHDKHAKVFMISKEDNLPFHRVQMNKLMWHNTTPPDVNTLIYTDKLIRKSMLRKPCGFYKDVERFTKMERGPALAVATGWCVLRVDADEHVVFVKGDCGERPIYYERALLAVGSKPKNLVIFRTAPKGVRDKVCKLRGLRDLESGYRQAMTAKHITIIGGGVLGMELAYFMSRMETELKKNPTLDKDRQFPKLTYIFRDAGVLSHIIPEYLGVWAAERIRCQDISIMPSTQVYDAFETEDGRVQLTLSNGKSIVTDYIFLAVGAKPREELAKDSFLELDKVNGGFLVNTEFEARTHLYVAGDAASYYQQWKNTRMRVEHELNAVEQGTNAGANMTGYWIPYNGEPHYWVTLGDQIQMEVIGEVGAHLPTIGMFLPCTPDEMAIHLEKKRKEFGRPCYKKDDEYKYKYRRGIVFYIRDETVVGFVFWNFPAIEDRLEVVTELLRAGPSYKDVSVLAELLGWQSTQCNIIPPEEVPDLDPCVTEERLRRW